MIAKVTITLVTGKLYGIFPFKTGNQLCGLIHRRNVAGFFRNLFARSTVIIIFCHYQELCKGKFQLKSPARFSRVPANIQFSGRKDLKINCQKQPKQGKGWLLLHFPNIRQRKMITAKKDACIVFDIISNFIATKNYLLFMIHFCKCLQASPPSYYVVQKQYKEVTLSEVGSYFRERCKI